MKKPVWFAGLVSNRTVLLVVIAFGALAALLLALLAGDDWEIVILAYFAIVFVLVVAWVALRGSHLTVPAGKAVIVKTGGFERAYVGPAQVSYSRFADQIAWHTVRQRPADLTCECNTRDHFTVKISLTIFWDAQAGGLPDIVAGRINVPEIFVRLAQARLLFDCARLELDELEQSVNLIAERVRDFLNRPENCESLYQVKSVLITAIKLPPEVTAAALRLWESQTESAIARTKRQIHFRDHLAESKAHALELEALDNAMRHVDPRTVAHHQAESTSRARAEV